MISIFLGHDSTIFKTGENLASGHTSKRETLRNNETFINQYLVGLCGAGAGRNSTNILGWLVDGGLGGGILYLWWWSRRLVVGTLPSAAAAACLAAPPIRNPQISTHCPPPSPP